MIYFEKRSFPHRGDTLICTVYEDSLKKDTLLKELDNILKGSIYKKIENHLFEGKKGEILSLESNTLYEHVILCGAGMQKEFSPVVLRDCIALSVKESRRIKSKELHLFYVPKNHSQDFEYGKQVSIGFELGNYEFNKYKGINELKKQQKIHKMYIYSKEESSSFMQGVEKGRAVAQGVMLARDLVNEPASVVDPARLVEVAFEIEKDSGKQIRVEILDRQECARLGMNAYLGVAKGSVHEPRFIILHYTPKRIQTKETVCLIGKSITFDSGGLSLKPSKGMEDMKTDMSGGAAVLGIFHIMSRFPDLVNQEVWGLLPACENMPSGSAMRPGDVVKALNGKTIEVLNTDAEGRLALADAISYAESVIKPDKIIDIATLTGACIVALGQQIAGVFGNNAGFTERFLKATKDEGEDAWELPLHASYATQLKSDIADIKNITGRGYAGAITAGLFLKEFVKKSKWIHIDIAGPSYQTEGGHALWGKGGTGWGVLSIINLLSNIR